MPPRALAAAVVLGAALTSCPGEAGAGAWTLPKGRLWLKVSAQRLETDRKFANDRLDEARLRPDGGSVRAGERIPFDFTTGGEYRVVTVALEGAYGITDRLEVRGVLPYNDTRFSNDNDEVEPGAGIGDVRLGAAVSVLRRGPWVGSAALEVKLPTADAPRSLYRQPLGEGQIDITASARGGLSLWPSGWAGAEVGFRWRAENEDLGFNPGNEGILLIEGGLHVASRLDAKVALTGLLGGQWSDRQLGTEREIGRRRLITLAPAVGVEAAPGWTVELGVEIPLGGEDLPTGVVWRSGLSTGFSRPVSPTPPTGPASSSSGIRVGRSSRTSR